MASYMAPFGNRKGIGVKIRASFDYGDCGEWLRSFVTSVVTQVNPVTLAGVSFGEELSFLIK